MISHIIHYKGKGYLVFLLPLLSAFILFLIFDGAEDEKFVGPAAFLISSTMIYFADKKPDSSNLFMWIKMSYCGIAIGVVGLIWFISKFIAN